MHRVLVAMAAAHVMMQGRVAKTAAATRPVSSRHQDFVLAVVSQSFTSEFETRLDLAFGSPASMFCSSSNVSLFVEPLLLRCDFINPNLRRCHLAFLCYI